jgi:glutamine---fructose-6-phosphate transaminase (isomerizing)
MCGIVGYVGPRDCGPLLLDGLRRLEYRGYDSAGIALIDDGKISVRRAEGKLRNLEAAFYREPLPGKVGIGHTRWATHGRPNEQNAHPHRAGSVVVVHNGIIENHLALKRELQSRGRVFESDTDTEIIAHLIDEALAAPQGAGHPLHAALRMALARLEGAYAIVALSEDHPDVIVAARVHSPLVVGLADGEQFAASDVPAVLEHTRDFVFLDDGDTAVLRADAVEFFDGEGQAVVRTAKRINWDPVSAEKQGYKHFMLKEIHEQAARVADTLRGRIDLENGNVELGEVDLPDGYIKNTLQHVQVVACGTSYHSGLVGRYLMESLARVHTSVDLASEFRYASPVVDENTLCIAISQSGETADTLAALREARRHGAKVVAICNVMESTIARESDFVIYTHAGPEIGVASTKAFTTQLAALFLLAVWVGRQRGTIDGARGQALLTEARHIPSVIEEIVSHEEIYHQIARDFSHARSFLFLGRGINYPIALEGALKLKEISYIHAEGYASGEMKHGPIALIDDEFPIVVVAPKSTTYEKTFSNLEEVKARGGRVIAVATEGDTDIERHADVVLRVPDVSEELQPLVTVIPLQLLSYYIADFKGTDVDQPRNLAKSVTVE